MGNYYSNPVKKLINAQITDVPEFSLQNVKTIGKVVDVYDGDTCKIILIHDSKLMRFNCRLESIDCEEIVQKKSEPERNIKTENAIRARNRLIQLVSCCQIQIQETKTKQEILQLLKSNTLILEVSCGSFDKYGRLLVKLSNKSSFQSINDIMILEGYANKYDGKTKEKFTKN